MWTGQIFTSVDAGDWCEVDQENLWVCSGRPHGCREEGFLFSLWPPMSLLKVFSWPGYPAQISLAKSCPSHDLLQEVFSFITSCSPMSAFADLLSTPLSKSTPWPHTWSPGIEPLAFHTDPFTRHKFLLLMLSHLSWTSGWLSLPWDFFCIPTVLCKGVYPWPEPVSLIHSFI